jgi:hypothetical protein
MIRALLTVLLLALAYQPPDGYIRMPRLGITFINSGDMPVDMRRYQQALFLGAGWNRWPLYWDRVETAPGQYNWAVYDRVISADLTHGLQTNVILLGRPGFHQAGGSISNLGAPVFSDGTDTPGSGKTINLNNPWARFVYAAVQRYRPGGQLTQQEGWAAGRGVTVWEMWNEPDLTMFWEGSPADYARLLKVGYLAAKHADSTVQIMFGGLADPDRDNWLAQALAIYATDPASAAYNWYMDLVGVHSYTYARRSGEVVRRVRETLAAYGLSRPIWLNESGVPVWDDYPGPTWATADPTSRRLRVTADQQAAYVVQSTALAWAEGAAVVMYHQLYDDCGNQPFGSNFPPHNGELCASGSTCSGDAHGLFRNPADYACFSRHPVPGSPRPSAGAYRLLAEIFGAGSFENGVARTLDDRAVVVTFDRPSLRERLHVVWNRSLRPVMLDLPASGDTATMRTLDGTAYTLFPENGEYRISLPPATQDDFPYLVAGDGAAVGGAPFIIVEQVFAEQPYNPALPRLEGDVPPASPNVTLPAATTSPTPLPTVDPTHDTRPPSASLNPLPPESPPQFMVSWSGEDDSGIGGYLIWVSTDGGTWQPWLETTATSAIFSGEIGRHYAFAIWAVDLAGNWTPNVDLTPQAETRVTAG